MAQYFLQTLGSNVRHNLHDGLNTVGRNPTNDVRLTEASVSSFHCEIEVDATGMRVRDLQSTNGTRVNNAPVEFAEVRPGDELALGEVRLQVDREELATVVLPTVPSAEGRVPDEAARYRCNRCHKVWSAAHFKVLKVGPESAEARFCPACSGRCSRVDSTTAAELPVAEPSLLNRLTQNIRIPSRMKLRCSRRTRCSRSSRRTPQRVG